MMNEQVNQFLNKLFSSNDLNRLPELYDGGRIFSEPIIGVAKGSDPIFQTFKKIIAAEHLTPLEVWRASGFPIDSNTESLLRVLSIVFPYEEKIREESKNATNLPAEIYCVGRNYANAFMEDVLNQTINFFQNEGYRAVAGVFSDLFTIMTKGKFYSTWSERHIAFAAGLGTFSLHEGLITELGCNIRLCSIITDAPLEVTPRKTDEPYGNCLFYAKGSCKKCIDRCPAGAITEKGHDKNRCFAYEQKMARKMNARLGSILKPLKRIINGKVTEQLPPVGCAFCQFNVPCTSKNPIKNR